MLKPHLLPSASGIWVLSAEHFTLERIRVRRTTARSLATVVFGFTARIRVGSPCRWSQRHECRAPRVGALLLSVRNTLLPFLFLLRVRIQQERRKRKEATVSGEQSEREREKLRMSSAQWLRATVRQPEGCWAVAAV